jgi:hypothetical protein
MATTLPTITIQDDAVAQRLLAAFQGQTDPNGTALTAAQAYKRWLRDMLVLHVTTYENNNSQTSLANSVPTP